MVGVAAKRRVIVNHLNSPCASSNSSSGRPCHDIQLHVTSSGLGQALEGGGSMLEENHSQEGHNHTNSTGSDQMTSQDAAIQYLEEAFEDHLYVKDKAGGFPLPLFILGVFLTCLCFSLCCVGDRLFGQKGGLSEALSSKPPRRNQFVIRDRVMYEWDQTPKTLTFYTKPPSGVTRHNIEVTIWPCNVAIGRKLKPTFLNEELYAYIDVETSYWSLSSSGELEIHMTKVDEEEWPCVFKSHQPSD